MRRTRRTQRGAATLLAVILLVTVIAFSLVVALRYANSSINDTLQQDDSIAALFLAESGLERAIRNLSTSGACDDAGVGAGPTLYGFGRGRFEILSGAPGTPPLCRVRTRGTVGSAARTVEAEVRQGGGNIAAGTLPPAWSGNGNVWQSLSFTVSGSNRLLVVAAAIRENYPLTSVTWGAQPLTLAQATAHATSDYRTEIWYLINPAAGTNTVTATTGPATPNSRAVFHALPLTGVAQAAPIDASGCRQVSGSSSSLSLTTTVANTWIVDSLSLPAGVTPAAGAGQTGMTAATGGGGSPHVVGGVSYKAVPAAATTSMSWTWANSRDGAHCGIAVRPGGTAGVVTWHEP